jgi:hypothetical protein
VKPIVLLTALAAGCSWTIDDRGWLSLSGDGRALVGAPRIAQGDAYYRAADGRIWVARELPTPRLLESLEAVPQGIALPLLSRLTPDGVLSLGSLNSDGTAYRVTLDPLTGAPPLVREVPLTVGPLDLIRGPGYLIYKDAVPIPPQRRPPPRFLHILFDGGGQDQIPVDADDWSVVSPTNDSFAAIYDHAKPNGSPRYLVLSGKSACAQCAYGVSIEIAAYDLAAHQLSRIYSFELGGPGVGVLGGELGAHPLVHDLAAERIWSCAPTFTASLADGVAHTFPISCDRIWFEPGQEVLVQDLAATVWALDPDGATKLATIPGELVAAHGRSFVYSKSFDPSMAFDGWIGDRQIIQFGRVPTFSADGTRLRWLEDAAGIDAPGDLYSMTLATFEVHHLLRNVFEFDELPDGRLLAIGDAALRGPWNRAVVIDETKGEARWLASGVQAFHLIGAQALLLRDATTDVVLLSP